MTKNYVDKLDLKYTKLLERVAKDYHISIYERTQAFNYQKDWLKEQGFDNDDESVIRQILALYLTNIIGKHLVDFDIDKDDQTTNAGNILSSLRKWDKMTFGGYKSERFHTTITIKVESTNCLEWDEEKEEWSEE